MKNQEPSEEQKRFLNAWKRGIWLIGEEYFLIQGTLEEAINKNQLKPNFELISHSLSLKSSGQSTFLAAMYSFYDSVEGQTLLEQLGRPNLCDIAACLEEEYVEVIAELFLNYTGW